MYLCIFQQIFVAVDKTDKLKDHLMEEVDYNLLPKSAWDVLLAWYGLCDGQQPIARTVREHGLYVKDLKVEVYLTELKLCINTDVEECVTRRFSKTATLGMFQSLYHLLSVLLINIFCFTCIDHTAPTECPSTQKFGWQFSVIKMVTDNCCLM